MEQVCRTPRCQLDFLTEPTPVARARRIPASAPAYLAAHAEDWEFPTLVGVHPKRVLANFAEDRLDIYENQVVARLIDGLLNYLRGRIADVRRLLRSFQETERYAKLAAQGAFWKRRRVYEIWGRQFDSVAAAEQANAVLRMLRDHRKRLLSLRGSQLYRSVPRQARVLGPLKQTNILINDARYRQAAQLWLAWTAVMAHATQDAKEVFRSRQQLCRDFGVFCRLIVLSALDEFGFRPRQPTSPMARSVGLAGIYGQVTVDDVPGDAMRLTLAGPYGP